MAEAPRADSFAALVADFTVRLPARLREAAAGVAACDTARGAQSSRAAAVESVHRLAGSCGLYGHSELSEALARVEARMIDDADFARLGAELTNLATQLERGPTGASTSPPTAPAVDEPED